MVKVVQSEQSVAVESLWAKLRIVYIGLFIGVIWWLVTFVLNNYVVEPSACRDLSSATICMNSYGVSGSIASILVAILGIFSLIMARQPRPIIIATSSLVVLWNLGMILDGLVWWYVLLAASFLYIATYALFALISRVKSSVLSITASIVAVVLIQVLMLY